GRSAWTGGQRRADCARGHDAALTDDEAGLSDAVWCRIDGRDGGAGGTYGLADRPPGRPSRLRADSVTGRRLRLGRARTVMELSVHRRMVLVARDTCRDILKS